MSSPTTCSCRRPPGPHPAAAKLADFGGAWITGEDPLTRTGDVMGTLAYMAPEQAEGGEVGVECDLYSCALVCFEALSGVNPVRGATPAATARQIGTELPSLREYRPDLPGELVAAIDVALDPVAEYRADLGELRDALAAASTPRPRRRGWLRARRGAGRAGDAAERWPDDVEPPEDDRLDDDFAGTQSWDGDTGVTRAHPSPAVAPASSARAPMDWPTVAWEGGDPPALDEATRRERLGRARGHRDGCACAPSTPSAAGRRPRPGPSACARRTCPRSSPSRANGRPPPCARPRACSRAPAPAPSWRARCTGWAAQPSRWPSRRRCSPPRVSACCHGSGGGPPRSPYAGG